MRIGIDFRAVGFSKSGVGVYTYQLVKNLLKIDRSNVYYLFTDHPILNPFPETKNVVVYPIIQKNRFFWEQISLAWIANKLGLDILHRPIDVGGTSIPLKMKYVVTVHDLIPLVMKDIYLERPLHRMYYRLKLLQTSKQADHILTVSHFSKQEIMHYLGLPASKISVTYNCFDQSEDQINTSLVELDKLPVSLGRLQSKQYILGIGGSEYRKNNISLIHAFENLMRTQAEFPYKLVIVGKKWRGNTTLHDYVSAKKLDNRVLFLEKVSDQELNQLYKNAAVFVYPSLYEGFGIPLLEAMSYGTPTITSTCSALPEIAADSAILVNPTDTEELGQKLLKVLTDGSVCAELARLGRENVAKFNCTKMAEQTHYIYNSLFS